MSAVVHMCAMILSAVIIIHHLMVFMTFCMSAVFHLLSMQFLRAIYLRWYLIVFGWVLLIMEFVHYISGLSLFYDIVQ